MNRILVFAVVSLSLLNAACAFKEPTEEESTRNGTAASSGTIRFEVPADPDVADIPWLMAIDALGDQGYTVETASLSDDLSSTAMAQGDLDMASFSNQLSWSAVAQGAPFLNFMDTSANTFMVISPKRIQTCADLDGEPVAVNGVATVGWALFRAFLEDHCPEAEPDILVVKGGSNRMAALLSGEVAASMQDTDDLIKLERDRPGEFHPLVVFAKAFPGVHLTSYSVRRGFADQHPEMVKDTIRATLMARQSLQDADVLREAIIRYLDFEANEAQEMADTYLAQEIWDLGGGYTLESVQTTIDFLQEFGDLAPELGASDVADVSYYEAVLDEIGRP